MFKETRIRTIAKTLSYRLSMTLFTILVVYLFTTELSTSLFVGSFELTLKLLFYFLHERLWNRISYGKKEITPSVIWITGLPASGKTTVAEAVANALRAKKLKVEHLDGDTIRHILPKTGFSKDERDQHIKRVGYLASELEKHGIFVVASFISPYKESREFAKNLCKSVTEVHLNTPIEVCMQRDPKGLYQKAQKGKIKNFTGINDPYETPENPDMVFNTSKLTVEEIAKEILNRLSY